MKKFLLSFLLATSVFAQGDPPPYVKGQSASGLGNLGSTIQVPKNQSTKLNSYQARIETGNTNELRNPSFEGSPYNSGWTCPTGTISQAVGPDGFKALGIVSSGAGFECNQTFTSTADLKGTLARFFARVKTSAPNTFVCGLDGGSAAGNRVNCQKVSLTSADKVFSETSGFFNYGNMVYGIAIYSTDTAAFPTVIDDASMGAAGLTTTTIQGDTVYSARLATTTGGNPVNQNKAGWISSCTTANPTVCTLSGFTVAPTCGATAEGGSGIMMNVSSVTASTVSFVSVNTTTGALVGSTTASVWCQKSGADYANSSSSGILSSNADYGATPIAITGTWSTNSTYSAFVSRKGERAYFEGLITLSGAPNSAALALTLPAGFVIDTAKLPASNIRSEFGSTRVYDSSAGLALNLGQVQGLTSTTVSLQSQVSSTNTALGDITQASPVTFATGDSIYFKFDVPIVGWTQSPLAIIPLAGTATTPGYSGQVDDLVFGFGDTSGTPCTTGTCAYLRQAGNGIVKVDFVGTGVYLINTRRSYNLLFCTGSLTGTSYTIGFQGSGAGPGNSFTIQTGQSISNLSSWGTLFCKGYY